MFSLNVRLISSELATRTLNEEYYTKIHPFANIHSHSGVIPLECGGVPSDGSSDRPHDCGSPCACPCRSLPVLKMVEAPIEAPRFVAGPPYVRLKPNYTATTRSAANSSSFPSGRPESRRGQPKKSRGPNGKVGWANEKVGWTNRKVFGCRESRDKRRDNGTGAWTSPRKRSHPPSRGACVRTFLSWFNNRQRDLLYAFSSCNVQIQRCQSPRKAVGLFRHNPNQDTLCRH